MVWDNKKIAVITGLGSFFLIEMCLAIYILFPSTNELPEIATLPPVAVLPEQAMIPDTGALTSTPVLAVEPSPTFMPVATATELLPITLETICLPQETKREYGIVTEVIDGDTIRVDIGGTNYSVRYIGMDTPEVTSEVEYCGSEASQRNRELVAGKEVTLVKDVSETDRYNRLLRYVLVGETFINYTLVVEGYASVATFPPDVACIETFRQAEQNARDSILGCWVPTSTSPQPTSPPPTLPPPPPLPAATSPPANANCSPYYPDVCLAIDEGDYDCAGGSGNGPNYVSGPIRVLPPDPFDLDRDGDGIGCE